MNTQTNRESEILNIVRTILVENIQPERIICGDAKTYIAVSLDGRKTRPICRLYINQHMYIGTINERKVETKNRIFATSDIFKFSDDLKATIRKYEQ